MTTVNWTKMEAVARELAAAWSGEEPGGAILGFDTSGTRFAVAGGLADLSQSTPFSAATVIRLASITKHIFGSMVLMHPQILRPDQPVGAITDGLPSDFADLTVAQALNMTGGLPDTREALVLHGLDANTLLDEAATVAYSAALGQLNYPAGTELSYTNLGYRLLEWGLRSKGLSFTRFVADRLRAGLGHALYAPVFWGDPVPGLVPGYWLDPGAGWQPGFQGMPLAAAGNICGSAEGLAGWLRALYAGSGALAGVLGGLRTSGRLRDGRETGYGLGLATSEIGGRRVFGHGGSQAGYKAQFLVDSATGAGIVVTSNREDTLPAGLARRCYEAGFGLAPLPALNPDWAPDGLYYEAGTGRWLEVKGTTVTHLSAGEQLYAGPDGPDGLAVSASVTSPFALRWQDGALVGEIGYAPAELRPARGQADSARLEGHWEAPGFGAGFEIRDGQLIRGIGPARQSLALSALHEDAWLCQTTSKPWPARICLRLLPDGRLELATARARHILYSRRA